MTATVIGVRIPTERESDRRHRTRNQFLTRLLGLVGFAGGGTLLNASGLFLEGIPKKSDDLEPGQDDPAA